MTQSQVHNQDPEGEKEAIHSEVLSEPQMGELRMPKISVQEDGIRIFEAGTITEGALKSLRDLCARFGMNSAEVMITGDVVRITPGEGLNGSLHRFVQAARSVLDSNPQRILDRYPVSINFDQVNALAHAFSLLIQEKESDIVKILTRYESYEVAKDEMERSLDILQNLHENREYFKREIGAVASFLPRNQPLYALCCFGIVPSLMAETVYVRPPTAMKQFFGELAELLQLDRYFENLHVSNAERTDFLKERAGLTMDPVSGKKVPKTDAVIFTGTMENADKLRKQFHSRTLFIANGAGHNPVVVTESADIEQAVAGAESVQLYNQGQDCAGPNSILVHASVYEEFVRRLKEVVASVPVGPYANYANRIGPISDQKDLARIQQLFIDNAPWIDPDTPGVIDTANSLVFPTIIKKPLAEGGNYVEQFSPVFFVQRYETDPELAKYFDNDQYAKNAMYVTVYGHSDYVDSLVDLRVKGKRIHDESTIVRNRNLHSPGVERGTQPYGGYGRGASCFSLYGKVTSVPTLAQRDIYEQLVQPTLEPRERPESKHRNAGVASGEILRSVQKRRAQEAADEAISEARSGRVVPKAYQREGTHWSENVVDCILERYPDADVYTCAAGISPSGIVHFGNFRDVMTALAVHQELKRRGLPTRLIFSWDDYDRLRKVPKNVDASFEQHIGKPLVDVPDPLGQYNSYAERFEKDFERSMRKLGIQMEYRYQSKEYRGGAYDDQIVEALRRRTEIGVMLLDHMSDKGKQEKNIDAQSFLEGFYPVSVYSRFSGTDNTEIVDYDGDSTITYRCLETENIETVNLREIRIAKLNWKVDWPMRWRAEGVVFEPGGADHASPQGSYEVASYVSRDIYGYKAPVFVGYEFIGIRGLGGKMSSSKGGAVSVEELLQIYEPEVLRWLYNRKTPDQGFELAFDTEVFRQYDEFDRAVSALRAGAVNRGDAFDLEMSLGGAGVAKPIPFRHAVQLGQIVQWDAAKLEGLSDKLEMGFDPSSIRTRLAKAREWLESYNPDRMIALLPRKNSDYIALMTEQQKTHVRQFAHALKLNDMEVNEIEALAYRIPKDLSLPDSENKKRQRAFFMDVYNLLIGDQTGPRLSTFVWAIGREKALTLLDVD